MKKFTSIFILFLVFIFTFVSCGGVPQTSTGDVKTATEVGTTDSKGGIVVVKPSQKSDVYAYLDIKQDGDKYVAYFHVKNPSDSTYEYTSSNGCVVKWQVYKKGQSGMVQVFPPKGKPPICTQQIVIITVKPGEDKVVSSYTLPGDSGVYIVKASMGTLHAEAQIEVK